MAKNVNTQSQSAKKATGANRVVKKKVRRIVQEGQVKIKASFNNTIITVTDDKGNVLAFSSAGKHFKGSRKSTPFAAQTAAEEAYKKAKEECRLEKVRVFVKGPGTGREAAIRALGTVGLKIISITDNTPLPHNGCRPPKERRV